MLYLVQNYLVPAYFILVSGLTSRNVKTLVQCSREDPDPVIFGLPYVQCPKLLVTLE